MCGRGSLSQDEMLECEGGVRAWGVAWSPGGGCLTSPASLAIGCELSSPKRQQQRWQHGLVSGPFTPRLLQPPLQPRGRAPSLQPAGGPR